MVTETPVAPLSGVGNAIDEALQAADEYARPIIVEFKEPGTLVEAPAMVGKDGLVAVPDSIFDDYRDKPKFRRGTATLTDLDSFIAHVERFKSEESAVFARDDRTTPSLIAVLDYHPKGAGSDPAFGKHRSAFSFPLSDEWKAWHGKNGARNAMTMGEFAEFLEDRIIDVEHPMDSGFSDERTKDFIDKLGGMDVVATPTRLLELSTSLAVNENAVVRESTKLASGEGQVVFQSEHVDAGGAAVNIPSLFVLTIPVFKKGAYYRVVARLRYRVRPTVVFWYELWRDDLVFDHAFDEALEKVRTETGLPVLLGTSES
jgi:hypothetical protein